MIFIANFLVAVVAALHVYFLILEMFLWTKPLGLKTFRNSIEKATESAVLAANQGLYNGFLGRGPCSGACSIPIRPSPSRSRCSFCSA
jgi:putative membrane protein